MGRVVSMTLFVVLLGAGEAHGQDHCGLEDPAVARRAGAVARKPGEIRGVARWDVPRVRPQRAGQTTGALSGKTVYVSPGHGFTWSTNGWRTQRGNTNDLVEDLVSTEATSQLLVQYLRNMGAYVVTVRESDPNPNLVLVDEVEAETEGTLMDLPRETGWGPVALPIADDDVNPFVSGSARTVVTAAAETGRIVFPTSVPETGAYNVYVSYVQGPDRASDAHAIVRHGGGESHFRVDQRRHGGTWVLLGRFWFEAGAPVEESSVVWANDSADPGSVLSVDAVRLGGGAGLFDRGGGAHPRPMIEHNARYYAQWSGAPRSVFDYSTTDGSDDVGTRSRFAAWDHEDGEDAVYLSWHSNAPNPGRGTETYAYGDSPPPGPLSNFSGTPGSLELLSAVHDEIVGDIRAVWDPAWRDRGKFTAYFGEVNPSHNPEMPAILVEVAFHDTPEDAASLADPRFRRIVARAMAQGVARYFATRDGLPLTLPPEPPHAVRVENDGAGGLVVSWRPPPADDAGGDPADRYRVYVSKNGYAFDDGVEVDAETWVLTGLAAGESRYVRVAAVNAGGESLPSEVVGARVAARGAAPVLVVGGFDRLDAGLLFAEDLSQWAIGLVDRMWLHRINDGTYAARHGAAVAAARRSFDGASNEAVAKGDVDLAEYVAVDWFVGEESTEDLPFDADERAAVERLLVAGGRLFVSGSEIGWALDSRGSPEEQSFFRETLHAQFAGDDAGTFGVAPLEGPLGAVAPFSFGDPASGAYVVEYPDVLVPQDAAAVLAYRGGAGIAAVAWGAPGDGERGVLFGFPFETIEGEATRAEVMTAILDYFDVPEEDLPGGDDPGDGLGGGCGCRGAGSPRSPGTAAWLALLGLSFLLRLWRKGARGPDVCYKRWPGGGCDDPLAPFGPPYGSGRGFSPRRLRRRQEGSAASAASAGSRARTGAGAGRVEAGGRGLRSSRGSLH